MDRPRESQGSSVTGHSVDVLMLRAELERMLAACTTLQSARQRLADAESLARRAPDDTRVRMTLLLFKERAALGPGLLDQWADLLRDCPVDLCVVRHYASRLVKERRIDDALALVDKHTPEQLDDPHAALVRAELLSDIKAHAHSDALFRRLIERHGGRRLRVAFARHLAKRGMLADAVEILQPILDTLSPDTKGGQLAARVSADYAFYRRFETPEALAGQDIKIVSMKLAILQFRNRVVPARQHGRPLSVALVTGSLGPGGAERQLARLAVRLEDLAARRAPDSDALTRFAGGAVEVLVKQHSSPAGAGQPKRLDFFLEDLLRAGVKVSEINSMQPVSVAHQPLDDADLSRVLGSLPPQVHYGVTRLAPYLRERNFDVVSLWQDGTCLFGLLAALLAAVPVIHLVFRGLPPNIRRERYRPEYEVLLRVAAEIPGVSFVSNSQTVAAEYAKWLGLPVERFRILYNGVPEMTRTADAEDRRKWDEFASATAGATETIGGVFRLEPDKRPLLWIKLAHRYLKRRPDARFLIVGDGRFYESASALAAELGIAKRLLLVGLSNHVGFWYSKMDAKVLLSRHEGLPNVLIEAQLSGICTVSTPAGGAAECFIDGVTGHLLECLDNPDLNEACEKIEAMVKASQSDIEIGLRSRQRARTLFSVQSMINTFLDLCATTQAAPLCAPNAGAQKMAMRT